MAELIPCHVQKVFARVYHESRTVSPTQLVVAVESHAGHGRRGTCRFRAMLARRRRGSSAKWERYRCGQRGHIARTGMAPSPVASGGEQGHSSAARQQRPPKKGNNRGHRGAERGDLPRVVDLRGPLLPSSSIRRTIPGPLDRGRVERLHNGLCRWTRVPPLLRRRWRRRRCRQQQRRARCLPLHRG